CGSLYGVSLVQLIPCAGIHGRHGQPCYRWNHCRIRGADTQRTAYPDFMRGFPCRKPVGHHAGSVFQIYETEIWRRSPDLPDVAPPSPLPEKRISRSEDRHTVLDIEYITCYPYHRNI